jgi:hypothetical protein
MTVFKLTADASDIYRESTGDQYARIVSSTESGNFIDETKNSTTFATTVVAMPTTMLRSQPRLLATVVKFID